jgi:predicted transcriptional regulator
MTQHALLISIRPRFAAMIFEGTKTVELRRVKPRAASGDLAFVYVSSPTKELQGAFEVAKVVSASPSDLWVTLGRRTGISRAEFRQYFAGKEMAHAIVIRRAWKLPLALPLPALRERGGGFQPPQSFHYIRRLDFTRLFGISDRAAAAVQN